MKNKKIIIISIIAFVFIFALGITYAYFTATLITENGPHDVITESGTLSIRYTDGPEINIEKIRPSWSITKTVTVENTGSLDTYYSFDWLRIFNNIERDELVMSATCTGTGCKPMQETSIGNVAGPFLSGILLSSQTTHTYVFTFKFIETNSIQNYNQGKEFYGVLNVKESIEVFTLNGTLLDDSNNPIANATITLHSEPQTTITDEDGKFIFENVEIGNHTITGMIAPSEEILNDSISFVTGNSFSVTGTNVTKESSIIYINIKINSSKKINSITESEFPSLLTKMNISSAQSDASIDFEIPSSGKYVISGTTYTDETKITNGLYYTSDLTKTENGTRVYYYRGVVENNYVVFAGYCWRIVRTNENGSIRLRYGGTLTDGSCPKTGTNVYIVKNQGIPYNQTYNDVTYSGYMMGMDNQCDSTTQCKSTTLSTEANALSNTYDSNIKTVIDNWYATKILTKGSSVTDKISNAIYCNDRSIGYSGSSYEIGTEYSSNAYGQNIVMFGSNYRLSNKDPYSGSTKNIAPQYKCPNLTRDGFTLRTDHGGTSGYGNNALTYPIGLLTADEITFAGMSINSAGIISSDPNDQMFLYTNTIYWTMTPSKYKSSNRSYVYTLFGDIITDSGVSTPTNKVIPSISLISSVKVSSGTGEYNSPYIIE